MLIFLRGRGGAHFTGRQAHRPRSVRQRRRGQEHSRRPTGPHTCCVGQEGMSQTLTASLGYHTTLVTAPLNNSAGRSAGRGSLWAQHSANAQS